MPPFGRNGIVRFVVLAGLASVLAGNSSAQEAIYSEDEVKAAFLYHFATYVQWPASVPADRPLSIAVLGASQIVANLDAFLPGRTVAGRSVTVRALEDVESLADDDVLFIGAEHNARLTELIESLGDRPILVVTDAADGLDHGAIVNFQTINERVRFEVSVPAAQNAGLRLSSRLLSAAIRVETIGCSFDCYGRDGEKFAHAVIRRPEANLLPIEYGPTRPA
jgi:hypothetical protein